MGCCCSAHVLTWSFIEQKNRSIKRPALWIHHHRRHGLLHWPNRRQTPHGRLSYKRQTVRMAVQEEEAYISLHNREITFTLLRITVRGIARTSSTPETVTFRLMIVCVSPSAKELVVLACPAIDRAAWREPQQRNAILAERWSSPANPETTLSFSLVVDNNLLENFVYLKLEKRLEELERSQQGRLPGQWTAAASGVLCVHVHPIDFCTGRSTCARAP